jgi:outer membrane protein insertion porin family
MIHRIKYELLLSFFLLSTLNAQSIQNIEINGNITFNDSDIKSWIQLGVNSPVYTGILDSVKNRLADNLARRGYFNASFEGTAVLQTADSQKVNLVINIDEGSPTYFQNIFITSDDSASIDQLQNRFDFLESQVFNEYQLEEIISDVLSEYENKGHPFIKISIQSIQFYDDSISGNHLADVKMNIRRGEKRSIDKIEIRGNTSTKDYVIIRELRIIQGEEYSQENINELPKRLNRLRFFQPVNIPQYYINSRNEGILLIEVVEKQTNNFDGIIGYIPGGKSNQKGYVTGLVNVVLRNLFGTGRSAAIRWQKLDRFSQELELKYLEPWLFGFPFNINGTLFQRKQDTTYVHRKLEVSLEYLATEDISAALLLGTESVIPTQTESNINRIFNSTLLTSGLNVKYDTRDDPYSPTEGILFLSSYSFSRKKINGPEQLLTPETKRSVNLQRLTLNFDWYLMLFSRQVIALGLNGKELRGDLLEDSDLFRLGGTNTLRGYREDQFLGSRIFWSNFEYRFLLTRRTFAFAFFDTGYYLRNDDDARNIAKSEAFNIGYGIGLNIETGLGVLGVSFALAKGDSFGEGKIHFGLVNEF